MTTLTAPLVDLALDDDAFGRYLLDATAGPDPKPIDPDAPEEPDEEPIVVFVVPA